MCTAITLKNKNYYFGRNLDLSYSLGNKIIITPRNYLFPLKKHGDFHNKYAIIGMAISIDKYPLYFDGMNEKGLCMAGLNFPTLAKFHDPKPGYTNIAPFEFIPYILGKCSSIEEVKKELDKMILINIPFNQKMQNAPLHWIISDTSDKTIVVESVEEGLKVYDNPFGVLTNSPSFDYHCFNMNNYMALKNTDPTNNINPKLDLKILYEGLGAMGLPGDYTSVSRFVKATFNKWVSPELNDNVENITQFFHILSSVEMVKGAVLSEDKHYAITQYSCCMSYNDLTYYYKTYDNSQITGVSLERANLDSDNLLIFELESKQQIKFSN